MHKYAIEKTPLGSGVNTQSAIMSGVQGGS